MRKLMILVFLVVTSVMAMSQTHHPASRISEMKWELDYQIYMTMTDDSTYTLEVSDLFHVTPDADKAFTSEFVYYPVSLGEGFVNEVKNRNQAQPTAELKHKTLWSALHQTLGSGWVHFTNCLLYSLETENLILTAPLMKRPETKWKPDPVTETYKRTKKWDYYVPVNQKDAQKEYKARLKHNQLGDLQNIPESFITIFTETTNREYERLKEEGKTNQLAKIDLVKLMLGVNYLSEVQITYIRNSVLKAVKKYSVNKLPSVIIFENYEAAAAMSLNEKGYQIEQIVFSNKANLKEEEASQREGEIRKIIAEINDYNQKAFEKRLKHYYK